MKQMMILLIVFGLLCTVYAQDYQISNMSGYSVDDPSYDVYNGEVYLAFGTNFRFYRFSAEGINEPMEPTSYPDPGAWGPNTMEVAVSHLNGDVYCLYVDYSPNDNMYLLKYVLSTDKGDTWEVPMVLDTIETGSSLSTRIDVPLIHITANGAVYFVWYVFNNNTESNAIFISALGSQKMRLDNPSESMMKNGIALSSRDTGDSDILYFTYETDGTYYLRTSTDGGSSFGELRQIRNISNNYMNYDHFTDLLVTSQGKILFSYNYFGSNGTYMTESTDDGASWSTPFKIDSDYYQFFDIRLTANGVIVKTKNKDANIYVSASADGHTWSDEIKVNESEGTCTGDFSLSTFVSPVIIDENTIAVAWIDSRTGNDEIFYSKEELPDVILGVDEHAFTATDFSLSQNFPNPFNPSTTIQYSLDKESFVSLIVYDILGNEIERVVEGYQHAGVYQKSFVPIDIPSGIYLYTLRSNGNEITKKMLLVK